MTRLPEIADAKVAVEMELEELAPIVLRYLIADSGEGGQCLRFKADSITVIADTCSRRRLQGSQVAIFSSSPDLVL